MASLYGYVTLEELENFAVVDYSTVDSALTDVIVESKISDAEMYLNSYVGTTFTGTIPDRVKLVTKMIAKIFMDNHFIEHRIAPFGEGEPIVEILERYDIVDLLNSLKDEYSQSRSIFIKKYRGTAQDRYYTSRHPLTW